MEEHMWAGVKRPTWDAGSADTFLPVIHSTTSLPEHQQKVGHESDHAGYTQLVRPRCTVTKVIFVQTAGWRLGCIHALLPHKLGHIYSRAEFTLAERTGLHLQASQDAPEDTTWQEYRPEDFGIDIAAGKPGQQEEDELLRAAIQASKAHLEAEEAAFMSVHGKGAHAVLPHGADNGHVPNGTSQHAVSHRAWFPPADSFACEASTSDPAGTGADEQVASSGAHEKGSEDTYNDVMAYLLGS